MISGRAGPVMRTRRDRRRASPPPATIRSRARRGPARAARRGWRREFACRYDARRARKDSAASESLVRSPASQSRREKTMTMAKRILVPLDGEERSEAIVPLVAAVARDAGATVRLLRVYPVPERVEGPHGRTVEYVDQAMERLTAEGREDLARDGARADRGDREGGRVLCRGRDRADRARPQPAAAPGEPRPRRACGPRDQRPDAGPQDGGLAAR